jgi:hypothetical protein
MKIYKIIFLFLLFTQLSSCAGVYRQASYVSERIHLGMSIAEFKSIAGGYAKLEAMEEGYTVFRAIDKEPWYGMEIDRKFYYFNAEGKLIKFDGGQFRQNRYQIEYINR